MCLQLKSRTEYCSAPHSTPAPTDVRNENMINRRQQQRRVAALEPKALRTMVIMKRTGTKAATEPDTTGRDCNAALQKGYIYTEDIIRTGYHKAAAACVNV